MDNKSNLEHIRHSLAHLLAAAVLKEFPDAKFGIGPVIDNGFYYDFELPRPITPDDLKTFEKTMRKLAAGNLPFTEKKVSGAEAEKIFKDQPLKFELIKELEEKGENILEVFVHGILHLCGCDHENGEKEAKVMEKKQEYYLSEISLR